MTREAQRSRSPSTREQRCELAGASWFGLAAPFYYRSRIR